MMSEFQPIIRASMERDLRDREKSQSDERSISHGATGGSGGQWGSSNKGKVVIVEVEAPPNSTLSETLREREQDLTTLGYQIRPQWGERFGSEEVRTLIKSLLEEFFQERKSYNHDEAEEWVERVSKECIARVKAMGLPRYKFVAYVQIGEHIGGGFHTGMKCCWDADSDMYATYTYVGDNLFCVTTICGIYTY